jgi:hypothetical protein
MGIAAHTAIRHWLDLAFSLRLRPEIVDIVERGYSVTMPPSEACIGHRARWEHLSQRSDPSL